MNQKQKIISTLKTALFLNVCHYIFNDGKTGILNILIVFGITTVMVYILHFVIFRYIAKNWLKWEEVKPNEENNR